MAEKTHPHHSPSSSGSRSLVGASAIAAASITVILCYLAVQNSSVWQSIIGVPDGKKTSQDAAVQQQKGARRLDRSVHRTDEGTQEYVETRLPDDPTLN